MKTLCAFAPMMIAMTTLGHGGSDTWAAAPQPAPGAAADVPRRDMITTLPAPGPHPSLGEQARIFDRFVGAWDCDYVEYAPDGKVSRFPGEVIFGWILDGRALQDIWISHDKGESRHERGIGTTLRMFDAKSGKWRIVWVDPEAGAIKVLTGGAVGDRIVLEGAAEDGASRRWSFNDIRDDSFVWRGERSIDKGRTWQLTAEYHLRRRRIPPSPIDERRTEMIRTLPAPGPHPSLGNEAGVVDRLVGTWDCDYSFISEDGAVRHSPGELRFGWIIDGRALQDIWIGYPKRPDDERTMGTTVRFFDTRLKAWRLVFIGPAFGVLTVMQGGAEGNDRIVLKGQDTDASSLRWSFNDIKADSFVWRGERSLDGGKTWRLEEEHHMTRRPAGAAGLS